MELLKNCRYKTGKIPESYFYEIKTQFESKIEVCEEGRISVNEVEKIIYEEAEYCFLYQKEAINELDRLKDDDDPNNKEKGSEIEKLEKERKNIEKYIGFLYRCLQELERILKSADYHNKRRENLKKCSIKDRPQSSSEITDNTNIQTSEENELYENKALLVTYFPEFKKDYLLLVKHGFLTETDEGLRRRDGITKKFLSDYFKSLELEKPKNIKKLKGIPWTILENIFGEKYLKNSVSSNGKSYKECSKDFERWLKIKKDHAGK